MNSGRANAKTRISFGAGGKSVVRSGKMRSAKKSQKKKSLEASQKKSSKLVKYPWFGRKDDRLEGRIAVVIYTYDRYQLLVNLLDSLRENGLSQMMVVMIYDDASPKEQIYQIDQYPFEIKYYRFGVNHGRKNWYRMISLIFADLRNAGEFSHYFFTSDDMVLVKDGLSRAIESFDRIADQKKICLNLNNDRKLKTKWVAKEPKKYGEDLYRIYFVDMCFICDRRFLMALDFKIEKKDFYRLIKNQKFSSGVGQYLSVKLHQLGYNLYLVKSSCVIHRGNSCSKMNPVERKRHQLVSKV